MELTDEQIKFVRDNLYCYTWPGLGNKLGISSENLRKHCYKLGIKKHLHGDWTKEQNNLLISLLEKGHSPKEIAFEIGRTEASVGSHITSIGLREARSISISNDEAPYIAGYLEADGCFTFRVGHKKGKQLYIRPVITVSSTNKEVCKWFQKKFGGPQKIRIKYRFEINWNNVHSYCISNIALIKEIIQAIKPHIRFKQQQVFLLEKYCQLFKGENTREIMEIALKCRELNSGKKRHEASEHNKMLHSYINSLKS